jgi:O-acetyl-ADP-ribose deacetylase (regulator of RNase III)
VSLQERATVVVGDITSLDVDAIVNAANEDLVRGAGVCGAIFRAAGPELDEACRNVAPCPTGDARLTQGFNAKAHWIVHAVGPIWRGGTSNESKQLASAYRSALKLAAGVDANSIAFPAISTGVYGFPREAAAKIAVETIRKWCGASATPQRIVFCCFTEADGELYRSVLGHP